MRLSDLRDRVRLERLVATTDSHGGHASAWSVIDTVWALVRPGEGREALEADQVTAALSTDVWLRFRSDVSVRDRILHGARTLQIVGAVDPDGRRHWLRLACREVTA